MGTMNTFFWLQPAFPLFSPYFQLTLVPFSLIQNHMTWGVFKAYVVFLTLNPLWSVSLAVQQYEHRPIRTCQQNCCITHLKYQATPGRLPSQKVYTHARTPMGNPYPWWHKICQIDQNGTLAILAYTYCRQWE